MFIPVNTVGAQHAAQRNVREEEEMTPYSDRELKENWEFKIIRTIGTGFSKPEFLKKILAEEAQAGWTMVEKFDDFRIRLKRPASARAPSSRVMAAPDLASANRAE